MTTDLIIDFNNEAERKLLYSKMRGLRGKQRITIAKYRNKRSDRQNRFYWPIFAGGLAKFLTDQGQYTTAEQAHEILKYKFLRVTVEDDKAGILTYTRSTTDLSVSEFNEFLDHAAVWLSDMFGLQIPEPNVYHWKESEHANK